LSRCMSTAHITNAVFAGIYILSPVDVGRREGRSVRLILSGTGGKRRRVSLMNRRAGCQFLILCSQEICTGLCAAMSVDTHYMGSLG
jgi:hypothetical protein